MLPVTTKVLFDIPESDRAPLRDWLTMDQSRSAAVREAAVARLRGEGEQPSADPSELAAIAAVHMMLLSFRAADFEPGDFAESVWNSVGWPTPDRPTRSDEIERIRALVKTEEVSASGDVQRLAMEYERLFTSARVIDELRPVFEGNPPKVVGFIKKYTLRLSYADLNGAHELFVALETKDLQRLSVEVRTALERDATVRDAVESLRINRNG